MSLNTASRLTEFLAICKDTGEKFFYNLDALRVDMFKGLSPPSRSSKARKERNDFARAFPVAFGDMPPCDIPGFETSIRSFGIPFRSRYRPAPQAIEYGGPVAPEIADKFAFIDPYITRLIDGLASPTGYRVGVFCTYPGSGKSTQLIYRLRMSTLGEHGRLLVTQPRTVTMRKPEEKGFENTLPGFIAKHLLNLTGMGAGREVGVLYRGTTTEHDRYTKILFVTDGILRAWLSDGISSELANFSVVVIDEAHEMSTNIVFCLMMLRIALQQYPHLRLVIASATMDEGMFVEYFGGPTKVLVVKPDADAPQQGHPRYYSWPHGEGGYMEHLPDFQYLKDPSEAQRLPQMVTTIIRALREQPRFPRVGDGTRDVLVFLPTIRLINLTRAALEQLGPDVVPVACHAQLSPAEQRLLFRALAEGEQAVKRGLETGDWSKEKQYVLLATPYAQTSVTFPASIVIDSGLDLSTTWSPEISGWEVAVVWHTRSGSLQRYGRVGRYMPGLVIPLYDTSAFISAMQEYPVPALQREPLDMYYASALRAGVALDNMQTISPVNEAEHNRAIANLKRRGVIGVNGHITNEGRLLQAMPVSSVDAARCLRIAEAIGCTLEVATFLGFCASGVQLFLEGMVGERAYLALRDGCDDDLVFYLRIFHLWEIHQTSKAEGSKWSASMGLNHAALLKISDAREQLLRPFTRNAHSLPTDRQLDVVRLNRVRAALVVAIPEWVFVRELLETGEYRYTPANQAECPLQQAIGIDRQSCCVGMPNLEAFVCFDRQKAGNLVMARHVVRADCVEDIWRYTEDNILRLILKLNEIDELSRFDFEDESYVLAEPEELSDRWTELEKGMIGLFTMVRAPLKEVDGKSNICVVNITQLPCPTGEVTPGDFDPISTEAEEHFCLARFNEGGIFPGMRFRATVAHVDHRSGVVTLSRKAIIESIAAGSRHTVRIIRIFDSGAVRVEFEPSLFGFIEAKEMRNAVRSSWKRAPELGFEFEVLVASNSTSRILCTPVLPEEPVGFVLRY